MGYLKIITAILIWSSLGIFIRKSGLSNTALIFYQSAIAGIIQLLILSAIGQIKDAVSSCKSAKSILILLLVPASFLINAFLFYFAFTHTTIANAVLTHYTAPIFVALTAPLFLKEKTVKRTWIAIIISSVGLWLILGTPDSGEWMALGEGERRGIIAGTLSGLAYALIILLLKVITSKYPSLFIVFAQNSIAALILLPFALDTPLTAHSLPYVITMGILHSTIAPLLYVQGFKSVRANEAAILGYLEPAGAVILALIFLNEIPGLQALAGGGLILYSGYMTIRS
jgi:drug/metabolite transporter (DMT)-like permease